MKVLVINGSQKSQKIIHIKPQSAVYEDKPYPHAFVRCSVSIDINLDLFSDGNQPVILGWSHQSNNSHAHGVFTRWFQKRYPVKVARGK